MAQQTINVGTAPNDGTGTPLRTAFQYTNSNFSELYTATGPSGNNINVPGSATITGDLTVRTNKLAVTSTGVGVGTASPNNTLTVRGTQDAGIEVNSADSNSSRIITAYDPANTRFYINSTSSGSGTVLPLDFLIGNSAQYRIAASGVFTWFDGAGGTRMTLNATGLGVGQSSPFSKLHIQGASQAGCSMTMFYTGIQTATIGIKSNGSLTLGLDGGTGTTDRLLIDTTGNVGIGVQPSAWATYKAVSVGGIGSSVFGLGTSQAGLAQGAFFNNGSGSGWAYSATSQVPTYYLQINGENIWNIASSGTAGAQITAWNPAMKLDASGNLLVGTVTSPTGTKVGSIAKLGGVSAEGTNYISVSTTPVALARPIGTGALFFVAGYNTSGGAQGWWLVASTGASVPTVIASGNNTLLTVAFTQVSGVLNMNTTSGTLSVTAFAITN